MNLMGKSPYLSDSVLIATIEKEDILPKVIIKDILVANPQSAKSFEEYKKLLNTKPPQMLEVFPNPSKDYAIIHYNMEMEKSGLVEITDVNGILMKQLIINRIQDQVTVNTLDWKPGLYIATLNIDGKSIESVKFTLVK